MSKQEQRRRLARAWSAYLDLAMDVRLSDGTPLLQVVFNENPELRERLKNALEGTT